MAVHAGDQKANGNEARKGSRKSSENVEIHHCQILPMQVDSEKSASRVPKVFENLRYKDSNEIETAQARSLSSSHRTRQNRGDVISLPLSR